MVADAVARHPGPPEGRRLRVVGSVVVGAVVAVLAYLYVSPAAPDTVLLIVFGLIGAAGFQLLVFLWNLALAPSRMSRATEVSHAETMQGMQAQLDQKLKPYEIAAKINDLRMTLRDLRKDAYLGPEAMPHVVWNDRCAKLLEACQEFVDEQRNKFSVALHDAIWTRTSQSPLEIGKNVPTQIVLQRVDEVLASISQEIDYG